MSLEIYTSPTYPSFVASEAPARAKTMVGLLTQHTTATVFRTNSDTADSYDVVIDIGEGRAARISVNYDSSGETATTVLYIGYLWGISFRDTMTLSSGAKADRTIQYTNSLTVVNGGDMWELSLFGAYQSGSGVSSQILRATKLVSSIDSSVLWAGGLTTTFTNENFPNADRLLVDYTEYEIHTDDPANASNNIPAGKVLLFPALMAVGVFNELGVPTIGRQTTYYSSDKIARYTPFRVGLAEFIALGTLVIRSQ